MDTHDEHFDYAVSQQVDGTLADPDRFALGARLRSPMAERLADGHVRLNRLLRDHADVPEVDFGAFADSFSLTLAAEEAYAPAALPMRVVWTRRVAVAAAVMLTALAAWPFLPYNGSRSPAVAVVDVKVQGPAEVVATERPVTQIAIGPSEVMVSRGLSMGLTAKTEVPAKPQVVISAVDTNTELRPF